MDFPEPRVVSLESIRDHHRFVLSWSCVDEACSDEWDTLVLGLVMPSVWW